jgi:membrane-associated phospholipid phosphatase
VQTVWPQGRGKIRLTSGEEEVPATVPFMVQIRGFLLAFTVLTFAIASLIYARGNAGLFLMVNQQTSIASFRVFHIVTQLGDGLFFAAFGLAILLINRRAGLCSLLAFGFSSLVAQVLKRQVFGSWVRPKTFFEMRHIAINLPQEVAVHGHNSFPSGHTASAFCMAVLVAAFFPNRFVQYGALFLAALVGLSRIWMCQHFPLDVVAGAIIGVICGLLLLAIFYKKSSPVLALTTMPIKKTGKPEGGEAK